MLYSTFLLFLLNLHLLDGVKSQHVIAKAVIHLQDVLKETLLPPGLPARRGVVTFEQDSPGSALRISGSVTGLAPGKHGLHIYEFGNLENGCNSAGGHFNPENKTHGGLFSITRHIGDLGNIIAEDSFKATINIQHSRIPLTGPHSIIGRTLVVHAGEDDLGLGGHSESTRTGNSGPRVGCGVIGLASHGFNPLGPTANPNGVLVPKDTVVAKVVLHDSQMLQTTRTTQAKYRLGTITLTQEAGSRLVAVKGRLEGLTPGAHGFHVHTLGNLENGCTDAAGHYNPEGKIHGARWDFDRHVGDLGNIEADSQGVARVQFQDSVIQLMGAHSIIGRALVVHLGEDDLGLGGTAESLKTGSAGPRIACGVVGIASDQYNPIVGWAKPLISGGKAPAALAPPQRPVQETVATPPQVFTPKFIPQQPTKPSTTPTTTSTTAPRTQQPHFPQTQRHRNPNLVQPRRTIPWQPRLQNLLKPPSQHPMNFFGRRRPTPQIPISGSGSSYRSHHQNFHRRNFTNTRRISSANGQPVPPLVPLDQSQQRLQERPHLGSGFRPIHQKPELHQSTQVACDALPYTVTCANGERSQFTFRWYFHKQLHTCIPYPWGYCRGEHVIKDHPSLRSLKACERFCKP